MVNIGQSINSLGILSSIGSCTRRSFFFQSSKISTDFGGKYLGSGLSLVHARHPWALSSFVKVQQGGRVHNVCSGHFNSSSVASLDSDDRIHLIENTICSCFPFSHHYTGLTASAAAPRKLQASGCHCFSLDNGSLQCLRRAVLYGCTMQAS
jgi:hypothetical protein